MRNQIGLVIAIFFNIGFTNNYNYMKHLSFIFSICLLFLSGCSIVPKYPYLETAVVLDYSEYTKNGFFMTEANSVGFDYEAIGSVSAKVQSGYEVLRENLREVGDDVYGKSTVKRSVKYGNYKQAYSDTAIEVLYNKAKDIGANGLINIKVTYIPAVRDLKTGIIYEPDAIIVTGMAIRKKF